MATRKRGSLVDSITMEVIPFQYEPTTEFDEKTNYGTQKIIGRRLSHKTWVGTGEGELKINLILVGIGYVPGSNEPTRTSNLSKYDQAVAANQAEKKLIWIPDKLDGNGHIIERGHYGPNPNYNPKMILDSNSDLVPNPQYADPNVTANQALLDRNLKGLRGRGAVNRMLDTLRSLIAPQEDTGAPHPVWVDMGLAYQGRKFIVHGIKSQVTVTNYDTMEPTEAHVTLSLSEIPAVASQPIVTGASTAMTSKGAAPVGVKKLPSMMPSHHTSTKSKSKRRA